MSFKVRTMSGHLFWPYALAISWQLHESQYCGSHNTHPSCECGHGSLTIPAYYHLGCLGVSLYECDSMLHIPPKLSLLASWQGCKYWHMQKQQCLCQW